MKWRNLFPFTSQKPQQQPQLRDAPRISTPPVKEELTDDQLIERARQASGDGNATAAVELWKRVVSRIPKNPAMWKEAATNLTKLKALDASDEILCEAIQQFPGELELWYEWGRSAMALQQPVEEERRWTLMQRQFPKHVHGYLCGARLARKQEEFEKAEGLLTSAIARIGPDKRLLLEHANCAEAQLNWVAAIGRWQALEAASPLDASHIASFAIALTKAGKLDDARERLKTGLNKFPGDIALTKALSRVQGTA